MSVVAVSLAFVANCINNNNIVTNWLVCLSIDLWPHGVYSSGGIHREKLHCTDSVSEIIIVSGTTIVSNQDVSIVLNAIV